MRKTLVLGVVLLLSGCSSEQQYFKQSIWPFGDPNAPAATGETAERALGHSPPVTVLKPQAGDVWPGPVQPMPTLRQVQQNANLPLGEGYTPSLPSPYPPGQTPPPGDAASSDLSNSLYSIQNGVPVVPPPVPGHQR